MLMSVSGVVTTRWDGTALGKEAAPSAALCWHVGTREVPYLIPTLVGLLQTPFST